MVFLFRSSIQLLTNQIHQHLSGKSRPPPRMWLAQRRQATVPVGQPRLPTNGSKFDVVVQIITTMLRAWHMLASVTVYQHVLDDKRTLEGHKQRLSILAEPGGLGVTAEQGAVDKIIQEAHPVGGCLKQDMAAIAST